METIVDDTRIEAEKRHVILNASVTNVTMEGNPELLRRAIENLVRNAIRYSPEDTTVDISLSKVGSVYRISVRDHGTGVPEESLSSDLRPVLSSGEGPRPHQRWCRTGSGDCQARCRTASRNDARHERETWSLRVEITLPAPAVTTEEPALAVPPESSVTSFSGFSLRLATGTSCPDSCRPPPKSEISWISFFVVAVALDFVRPHDSVAGIAIFGVMRHFLAAVLDQRIPAFFTSWRHRQPGRGMNPDGDLAVIGIVKIDDVGWLIFHHVGALRKKRYVRFVHARSQNVENIGQQMFAVLIDGCRRDGFGSPISDVPAFGGV